jgi:hypothetical protein
MEKPLSNFDAYDVLLGIEDAELRRVAHQLRVSGLVTDEDGLCLGSTLIEKWSERCTGLLRQCGYAGGDLKVSAKFFKHCGAIYVLFDAKRHSLEAATEELRRAANRHEK